MASLPPKPNAVCFKSARSCWKTILTPTTILQAEAARLEQASHAGKAASTVNKFAKRDPALYPLILIVGGIFATAGYMLSKCRDV
jgi:hypothetical protein